MPAYLRSERAANMDPYMRESISRSQRQSRGKYVRFGGCLFSSGTAHIIRSAFELSVKNMSTSSVYESAMTSVGTSTIAVLKPINTLNDFAFDPSLRRA